MKKRSWLLMAGFSLIVSATNAQSRELDNVIKFKLQNTVTIKNNKDVVGYAFFYQVDHTKHEANYRLEILDENLKSIGSNEFEGSKELELVDAMYESGHILLAFDDKRKPDGYEKYVQVFDMKGKQTGLVSYDPDKVKKGMFGAQVAEQMERYYGGYNTVPGKGFMCVYQSKAKTGGVDMQMVSADGKLKWEKTLEPEEGGRMDAYLTATTPNAVVFFVAQRESIMARDSKNFLVGLNPENGKELYRKPMDIGDMAYEPILFKPQGSDIKMVSLLTHEDDRFYAANPIGMNISSFNDATGEVKKEHDILYASDLGSVLEMKSETKSEDGFIKVHDLCLMPDGSKVIVGEFFRRTVSALGLAAKIASKGGGQASQISIGDMFLLHIDANDKAVVLDKMPKGVSRVGGMDGVSIGLMSRVLGLEGDFGYMYTDDPDDAAKTVVARGKFDGERYGMRAFTFDQHKGFKEKKFDVDHEKKDLVELTRAKPGHVLVMKYSESDKKISLNLERVD